MIASKYKFIALLYLALCTSVTAQPIDDESNWYKEIGRVDNGNSRFDFTRYSKNDIQLAKSKYLQIMAAPHQNEWEGKYSRETMLGRVGLVWSQQGFVYDYVYHTLANIDYGRVALRGDSILLVSERFNVQKPNPFLEGELIRVRFGERHLMIARNGLKDFAIFAAGLDVPDRRKRDIYTEEGGVWEKVGDEDKSLSDVPTYPARYAYLIRKPMRAKVSSVGVLTISRRTSPDFAIGKGDHVRQLTVSGGSRNGMKVGMTFWIDILEERIEIVSVGRTQSNARLVRPFIDGKEFCRNDEILDGEPFACREPKIGMQARTKTHYF
ncbi:MAG: hypothetical protein ABI646_01350 [Acidobacteriota bacterium]